MKTVLALMVLIGLAQTARADEVRETVPCTDAARQACWKPGPNGLEGTFYVEYEGKCECGRVVSGVTEPVVQSRQTNQDWNQ